MNEELILNLVKGKLRNNQLTYEDFENIFNMLSHKEQYEVCDILSRKGIELVDEFEKDSEKYISEELLNDSEINEDILFRDSQDFVNDYELNDSMNRKISQSNEILCILIQQGDNQAKIDLCMKNKKLVAKYASRYLGYYGSKMSFDDLMQEGYIGLLTAANRFDASLDNAFSTYAVFWIMQSISRAIMETGFLIRIPVHMMERISKITKLDGIYEIDNLDYEKRMKKISEDLGIKVEDVKKSLEYRDIYLNPASLDVPIGEDNSIELIDFIEDKKVLSPDEHLNYQLLKDQINNVLQGLTEREEKVLRLRFGLYDGRTRTLEEVGKEFNVTRERIRQIEAKALRKLRHPSRSRKLKDYLGD